MRNKKILIFITIVMLLILSMVMVACVTDNPGDSDPPDDKIPPVEPPAEEIPPIVPPVLDAELVFGDGGSVINGVLIPTASVTAIASVTGKNYDMTFTAVIASVKVTWVEGASKGVSRSYTDSETIGKIAVLSTNINSLIKDVATDVTFTFTMPDTEDETFANAKFVFTVKLVGVKL